MTYVEGVRAKPLRVGKGRDSDFGLRCDGINLEVVLGEDQVRSGMAAQPQHGCVSFSLPSGYEH